MRLLSRHYGVDPAGLPEAQVREYFLMLRRERHYAAQTLAVAAVACRQFYREHLRVGRGWKLWQELTVRRSFRLPSVLTRAQTVQLLAAVRQDRFRTLLGLIYATGLRLGEACRVAPCDLRVRPGALRVPEGKGGKERYVPIAPEMVAELRRFWRRHRNPCWLFPSVARVEAEPGLSPRQRAARATRPMRGASVEEACRLALQESGLPCPATPHTLRHCYATHLLEEGVPLRLSSHYLGHAHLQTTMRYVHLTEVNESQARAALQRLYQQTLGAAPRR